MEAPVLGPAEWRARQEKHDARVSAWTEPHAERARRAEGHPVLDFLFTYYPYRPAQLRRWHPGAGVVLAGDPPHRDWPGYRRVPDGVCVDLEPLTGRRGNELRHIARLLRETAARPAAFGCFGMHEWAMVHRTPASEVRHAAWPLRLSPDSIAAVVEAAPLRCTHFDAFRFFTPTARPLNVLTPTREAMPRLEQGGCLHTNMDLYKCSYKLSPFTPAELVADCFALARDLRELDMRAGPYDLSALGYEAVAVETADGRARYRAAQQELAALAAALRTRLLEAISPLEAAAGG